MQFNILLVLSTRWNDKAGPDLQNSAVMAALMDEQNAQVHGSTTGRIHSTNGGSKQGLSFKVLQWLTGTDSEDGSETTSNCEDCLLLLCQFQFSKWLYYLLICLPALAAVVM